MHYKYSAIAMAFAASLSALQAADATTPEPPKKTLWESSAAVGLTLTRGNSETILFNGNVQAARKWDQNEINLGVDGSYGKDHTVKNTEQLHGYGQYNRLFTDRIFGYARVEGLHDAIAAVDYRVTISPGAGYYFIKATNTTLRAEVGPGWVYQQQVEQRRKTDPKIFDHVTDDYFTLRFAERFDQKLSDTVKIWQSAEYLPQIDDWGNYIINAELGLEVALSKKLSERTFLQDTYHSRPAAGRERNDLKLVAAIAYKF